ncbi:MAG: transcriptional regulator [Chloroflexi bacterium]|nr:transcriptional regulator [Chloroflexota bacterium]MCI0580225.1 transcriptional regulator [Chloroflexota bacterium]MCI0643441.1 transcriptional regulator [Chloroflexota bacterium]MCI0728679.1 transcriptional regulator [Chloroflexota bacterium]
MTTRLATRTARLRQIEELLSLAPEGLRATDIAGRLEVDRRTIYRDLDFLCDQGVPIWQQGGRFGINRTWYLPAVRLSFHEAIALVMAGLLLSRTIDERNPHVAAALRKLAVTLPGPLPTHLERAAERVQAHGDGHRQVAVLEAIAEGWGGSRKVQVNYRSPRSGSLRERVIAPYAIEPTASGIYVIGHDDWAEDIRTFKLDRLEGATVLEEPFTIPANFDPEAYLATGWRIMAGEEIHEVVLRFTSTVAVHVRERQWHPSQKLKATADGGCLLYVHVAEPLEMQPWIRSWGAQVEVLAPGWLREQIAAELRQAAEQYQC